MAMQHGWSSPSLTYITLLASCALDKTDQMRTGCNESTCH